MDYKLIKKILSAVVTFALTAGLTYVGVPVIAVIFLMAMLVLGNDFVMGNGNYKIDYVCLIIAVITCIITGNVNWAF